MSATSVTLIPHPSETKTDFKLGAVLQRKGDLWQIEYSIQGIIADIEFSVENDALTRAKNLWENTCFECFVKPEFLTPKKTDLYFEFNFSPSQAWNAFEFESYRNGMKELTQIGRPKIMSTMKNHIFLCYVQFEWKVPVTDRFFCQPTAILKLKNGADLHHFAPQHRYDKPNFHHSEDFSVVL